MKGLALNLTVLFFLLSAPLMASPMLYIDYYGVVSQSEDTNILKMAQDVFFTQLKSMQRITVDDKRVDISTTMQTLPDFSATVSPHIVFYAEIAEDAKDSGKEWICTFTILRPEHSVQFSKTEHYASYYKILVNAKLAIEDVLDKASGDTATTQQADTLPAAARPTPQANATSNIKIDSLAGTWSGESELDKIILLRGGKGFVIFKNGATMNIRVAVTKADGAGNIEQISITQDAKPNASFFPTLPRDIALANAATAEPILWLFSVSSDGSLSGTKRTLVQSAESETGAETGTIDVQWIKR